MHCIMQTENVRKAHGMRTIYEIQYGHLFVKIDNLFKAFSFYTIFFPISRINSKNHQRIQNEKNASVSQILCPCF